MRTHNRTHKCPVVEETVEVLTGEMSSNSSELPSKEKWLQVMNMPLENVSNRITGVGFVCLGAVSLCED